MTEENQSTENQQKKNRNGVNILGILLRLILTGLAGTIIGALVYFTAAGWTPYLDQRIFQPIDTNQANIEFLLETQAAQESILSQYQGQIASLQAAIEALDIDLNERFEDNTSLLETVETNSLTLLMHTRSISGIDSSIESTNLNLSALATAQAQYLRIYFDLSLLKIIDLLSLANQHLMHANYGQAEIELIQAGEELIRLQTNSPAPNQPYLSSIMDLIDGSIADLPVGFSLASEKIQLARQLVLEGFSDLNNETITPTPNPTQSLTPTPES